MEVFLDTRGLRKMRSVLLMCLCVVRAAADCPKPTGGDNMVLTDASHLINEFPINTEVTLECANGYTIESGSGIITCIDDKWTEPELICKKKDCGDPKPQPHMSFDLNEGTLFSAAAEVTCDKGYETSGSSHIYCYNDGWRGKPRCEIVTCQKPPEVTNGESTWDSADDPKYGEIVQYVCNEGFTLTGEDSIMCTEHGEYNSDPPQCQGVIKEDVFATKTVTPTSTSPAPETSTSKASPTTPTVHRDKTITPSATPTVSPTGGGDVLTAEDKATAASVTSMTPSSFQDHRDGIVDTSKDVGYTPVIVSVICVSLVVCIAVLFIHKLLLKRKGSANGTVPIC
ncbi:complement decay-accelerating factor isoform X2 [Sphaeramia orbicularis]|uniref:Sushi domain-containing protein n=1 Tax=Sphaeramia orbicularis TaxID=375764 RepID=A0A673A3L1_9TELE|nr:complement decay-accelerating factor isoform X2 [Sphaeramia orbicularis]